ncbi:FAS1 domain [Macleaya cordata]|uniref:FAS1 domain n=1 Tax=Macleaya cordata TaxID=56857 RepID=A0A200PXD1_MACCD|nr:FAS1 domain [Macleaya cordata]
MATYHSFLILLVGLTLSAIAAESSSRNDDLIVAIQEMQKANHFSFVMLLNMLPSDRVPENITFLMPNDRMLSNISLPEHAVDEFLLRHSIPSPLPFDQLKHFPTGSMIPTSKSNIMLKVSNNGRRSFYFNDVQITSPDICTAGLSIRCHGIDGVLSGTESEQTSTTPTCSSSAPAAAAAPASPSPPSPPSVGPHNLTPVPAPSPSDLDTGSQKSGSSLPLADFLLHSIMTCMILSLILEVQKKPLLNYIKAL